MKLVNNTSGKRAVVIDNRFAYRDSNQVELLRKEIEEWSLYFHLIFSRLSQTIDHIKYKLPYFRQVLKSRQRLDYYLKQVLESIDSIESNEEKEKIIFLALRRLQEIRSALAHCYTAIMVFEDALEKTINLLEQLPADQPAKPSEIGLGSVQPLRSKTEQIEEENLLKELQKIQGLVPGFTILDKEKKKEEEKQKERLMLGEILVKEGVVTPKQVEDALNYQQSKKDSKKHIGTILIELGYVDEISVYKALAKQSGYPFVENLKDEVVHHAALFIVPERVARQHECMPLQVRGNTLRIAISNPYNLLALEDLKLITNCSLDIIIAPRSQILAMIREHYKKENKI